MTNTIEQVISYARAHPKRDGGSWAGWCESFVWRAGGFAGSFDTALLAGSASGPLNPDWASAPAGALHYWAGVNGDGHVAFSLGGGMLLMASSRTSNYGTALGTLHFANYGLPLYRGWSMRHGVQTLAKSAAAPAATATTPIIAVRKKNTMRLVWAENVGYLVTEDGFTPLASPQVYSLFYRLINSDQSKSPFAGSGAPDNFNKAEIDIMNATLRLVALSVNTQVAIDTVKLAAALSKALGTKFDTVNVQAVVDPKVLAAAFEVAIPRIAKAVNDTAAARLAA